MPTYTATTSNGVLRASNTSDIINGNTSNDELWGLGGNDTVYGSDGNDLIEGDGAFTVADQVRVAGFATVSNLGVTGTTTQPLFTAMGQTSLSASIWRVRNLSDAAMTVSVKSANGSFSVDYVVPAHTDYIVSSSVLSTHKLYYNTSLVDTKGVSLSSYVDTTSYGVTVDGNDTIYGGNGNDIIHGGGGDDVISGDAGNDTIDGNAGNDTIDGGTGNDVIHGNDGNDTLTGNYGTDKLYGDAGNDTFLAEWDEGSGDYYDGGDGVDTYKIDGTPVQTYALQIDLAAGTSQYHDTFISVENLIGGSAADVFLGDAGANDLEGRDGNDTLDGRGGNDVLLGENGDDTLIGGDGNDSLAGGTGTDSLNGGTGNDLLVGGAGADKLVGGDGIDTADYSASAAGVTVNLAAGTGVGGDAQGDTLSSIENVTGSKFDDVLTGDAGANVLDGGQGNDVLAGGAGADVLKGGDGVDTVDYSAALAGVTVNLAAGTASDGDTLSSIENVTGSKFDDVLTGDAGANVLDGGLGNDVLAGGAGADVLKGGDGVDTADYSAAAAGMTVNLAAGTASDGDVLSSIENVTGSKFDDVLTGDAGANVVDGGLGNDVLAGGAGADVLKGGDGVDTADYSAAATGVTVNLAAGTASDGDTFSSIENVTGSKFDDVLTGDAGANVLDGGLGNDVLAGGAGADVLKGGDGFDTADYSASDAGILVNAITGLVSGGHAEGDVLHSVEGFIASDFNDTFISSAAGDVFDGRGGVDTADYSASNAAVAIDLTAHTAQGGYALNDTLTNVENLIGSTFNDTLTGNELANELSGGAGQDTLQGWAGDDTLNGGAGNDRLYGGAGADHLNGGDGIDTADYSFSDAGVTVSLVSNTGSGGDAQGDVLSGIENLTGSAFDDTLTGDAGANRLVGGEGADHLYGGAGNDMILTGGGYDTVDGGDGVDTVSYENSWAGVTVNLATGVGQYGEASRDALINVEYLVGSKYDDVLTGDAGVNRLTGGAGNDTLDGGAGNDVLVGGQGADKLIGGLGDQDAASYQDANEAVIVNLATGGTGGEAAGDTYSGVEYVYGSEFNDTITGDAAINRLTGGGGDDHLDGAGGNDYLLGEAGNDTLTGGAGADVFVFDKAFGNDTITDFWAGAGRTDRAWITNTIVHSFADVAANGVDTAQGFVLTLSAHDTITFAGLNLSQFNADDFIFV